MCRSPDGSENGMRRDGLGGAKSITDLAKRVEKSWEGGLILKNSLFPTKLLLTEGEMEVGGVWIMKLSFLMESLFSSSILTSVCSQVVEQLMRDEQDKPYLKITQRLQFLQFLMFWFPIAELLKDNSASIKLLPTLITGCVSTKPNLTMSARESVAPLGDKLIKNTRLVSGRGYHLWIFIET